MLPGVGMQYMDIMRNLLSTTAFPLELYGTSFLLTSLGPSYCSALHCIALDPIIPSTHPIVSSMHPSTHPPIPHSQAVLYSARITNTPPPFPPPFPPPPKPQSFHPSPHHKNSTTSVTKAAQIPLGAPKKKRNGVAGKNR